MMGNYHVRFLGEGRTVMLFSYPTAAYMGVSKKTVEAWEGGRTHPSGPAFRLLEVLASDNPERTNYVVVK